MMRMVRNRVLKPSAAPAEKALSISSDDEPNVFGAQWLDSTWVF
jgi:hypothetical protein